MKTGFFIQPYPALILKVAGMVLILGTLVDYIVLATPPNLQSSQWLTSLIIEWVSRGTVPLLGLGVLFLGVWFDRDTETRGLKGLPAFGLILAAILGVLFLVLAPLYFNSSRLTSASQTRQINEQAALAERQLNNLLAQQRDRVSAVISDEDQLAELQQQLANLDLPAEQQAQLKQVQATLEKVKSDPKLLDQEVDKARTEGMEQIQAEKTKALTQLQSGQRRERIHTTVSSLLFAAGYLAIAWLGLGGGAANRPKRPRVAKAKAAKPNKAKKKR